MFSARKHGFVPHANKVLAELGWVNMLRGVHGSGIAMVDKQKGTRIIKMPSCFETLASSKEYQKIEHNLDAMQVVIGHGRWATSGKVDIEHTHPFSNKKLILAHNGSLSHYPKKDKYKMDSLAIAELIAEQGVQETVNDIYGAYSLVWYDKDEKALKFLRNKERPMWIVPVPEQEMFYFASEPYMILMCLQRQGIKWDFPSVMETIPDQMYTYKLGNLVPEVQEVKKPMGVKVDKGKRKSGKRGTKGGSVSLIPDIPPVVGTDFLAEKWERETVTGPVMEEVTFPEVGEYLPKKPWVDRDPFPHQQRSTLLLPSSVPSSRQTNVIDIQTKRKVQPLGADEIARCPFQSGRVILFSLENTHEVRPLDDSMPNHAPQTRIIGSLPEPFGANVVVIEGMTKLTEKELFADDCMYRGEISSVAREAVPPFRTIVWVKDIMRSYMKDPQYRTKWEQEDVKKVVSPVLSPAHARKEMDNVGQCDNCAGFYKKGHLHSTHDKQWFGNMFRNDPPVDWCENCIDEVLGDVKQTVSEARIIH